MLSNKSDSTGFPGPRWHHPGETIEGKETAFVPSKDHSGVNFPTLQLYFFCNRFR